MKKKGSVFILLTLCIIIWGTIAWRVYSTLEASPSPPSQAAKPAMAKAQDSIHLLLNYRDPFLDESPPQEKENPDVPEEEPVPEPLKYSPPLEEEYQPDFQFKGTIRMGKSTQAIVFQHNESVLLKVKDKIGEFTVIKITEEQLTLRRKGKEYQLNKE